MGDLGVNLAGVEVVMRLMDRLHQANGEIQRLREENEQLKGMLRAARRP